MTRPRSSPRSWSIGRKSFEGVVLSFRGCTCTLQLCMWVLMAACCSCVSMCLLKTVQCGPFFCHILRPCVILRTSSLVARADTIENKRAEGKQGVLQRPRPRGHCFSARFHLKRGPQECRGLLPVDSGERKQDQESRAEDIIATTRLSPGFPTPTLAATTY